MYTDGYVIAIPQYRIEDATVAAARYWYADFSRPLGSCAEAAVTAAFCPCIDCADGGEHGRSAMRASVVEEVGRRSCRSLREMAGPEADNGGEPACLLGESVVTARVTGPLAHGR